MKWPDGYCHPHCEVCGELVNDPVGFFDGECVKLICMECGWNNSGRLGALQVYVW